MAALQDLVPIPVIRPSTLYHLAIDHAPKLQVAPRAGTHRCTLAQYARKAASVISPSVDHLERTCSATASATVS